MFKCDICGKSFKTNRGIYNHLKLENSIREFLTIYNLDINKIQKEYNNLGSFSEFKRKYPFTINYSNLFKLLNIKKIKSLICDICGKEIKGKSSKSALLRHQIWCKKRKDFLEKYNFTRDSLEKEYLKFGSILEFLNHYPDLGFKIYKLFKEFNIEVSIKKSSNSIEVKRRREESSIKNTGVKHNFCRNHPSRVKWQNRLLEEEGITTVFQRESVKEKIVETFIEKYGSLAKGKVCKEYHKGSPISKIHKKVLLFLEEVNISYNIEYIIKSDNELRSYYKYDILLDNNKIIEINGDKWHANPLFYKQNDILDFFGNENIANNIWEKDRLKIQCAINNNYKVLVLWENEINNKFEKIKKDILNYAKS